jgi:hypothetical protein
MMSPKVGNCFHRMFSMIAGMLISTESPQNGDVAPSKPVGEKVKTRIHPHYDESEMRARYCRWVH